MTALLPLPTAAGDIPSRIVLSWLIRLRWLAVAGQIVAIAFAWLVLQLVYPVVPLAGVLATTLLTNALLWLRYVRTPAVPPGWVTPAVLLLDVVLLTLLLYQTGGPQNPFAVLYIIHVAMASVVLGPGLVWIIVGVAGLCYGSLFVLDYQPLAPGDEGLPAWALTLGQWSSLLLVAGLMTYFIGRIVGALQKRDHEVATLNERAALAERLASLTTLAAGAAHELGTPLGTIAVVAKEMELAAREFEDTTLADDATLIREQVDRCRNILEHLRGDVAGSTTAAPGHCDTTSAVEGAVESLRPDRQERLKLESVKTPIRLAVPERAAQQALQFLINNAFDATPTTPTTPTSTTTVTLQVERIGNAVAFRVVDTGTGMDAETLRRATEPFFTTKDPGSGMGLGLFLVRLVAERHGGTLQIESKPNKGTTATLTLPIAR